MAPPAAAALLCSTGTVQSLCQSSYSSKKVWQAKSTVSSGPAFSRQSAESSMESASLKWKNTRTLRQSVGRNGSSRCVFTATVEGSVVVEEPSTEAEAIVDSPEEEKAPELVAEGEESAAAPKPQQRRGKFKPRGKRPEPTVATEALIPGAVFTGKVTTIQTFGAFVNFGAFTDGLVHISKLSSGYVTNVSDIVQVGQEVQVTVIDVDNVAGRIALSMAEKEERAQSEGRQDGEAGGENSGRLQEGNGGRPMNRGRIAGGSRQSGNRRDEPKKPATKLQKGQILEGTVKNTVRSGVYVLLPEEEEGFLRYSEIPGGENMAPEAGLQVGQKVTTTVLRIDRGKIVLTMKPIVDLKSVNQDMNRNQGGGATNPFETAFRALNLVPAAIDEIKEQIVEPGVEEVVTPDAEAEQVAPATVEETVAAVPTTEEVVEEEPPVVAVEETIAAAPTTEAVVEEEPPVVAVEEPVEETIAAVPTTEAVVEEESPVVAPEEPVEKTIAAAPTTEEVVEEESPAVALEEPGEETSVAAATTEVEEEESPAVAPEESVEKEVARAEVAPVEAVQTSGAAEVAVSATPEEKIEEVVKQQAPVYESAAESGKPSSGRPSEGLIKSYVHDQRVGVLVEVNCMSTKATEATEFQQMVEDLGMQVVASGQVLYVSYDDIPLELVNQEKDMEMQREDLANKPEAIRAKIVEGRVAKKLNEKVLLEQPYIRDDSILVKDFVKQISAKVGESITVRRFERYTLGEGLEKRSTDFAAEVAAQTQGRASAPPPPPPAVEEKSAESAAPAPAAEESAAPAVSAKIVKELRDVTGAGMMDCKKALKATNNNLEEAILYLRKKGLASAAKKASRIASEGLIESYIHDGGRVGVLVEVNCETDFVSRGEQFKSLVKDISLQIVHSPLVQYVRIEDVPAEIENKAEVTLLEQPYIKNSQELLKDVVKETVATLGENIQVRRFTRYNLGEGL